MTRKIVVTCALTGGHQNFKGHPNFPITPAQIAESALEAGAAGAAVVHVHVRDPESGGRTGDVALFREVVERIRASGSDILLNLTTGEGARFVPGERNPIEGGPGSTLKRPELRVRHVEELRPEICTLDMGSMNFGDQVFTNTPEHLRTMARAIKAAGVKPELEVFDAGHIRLARQLVADGEVEAPAMFQLCLGIDWGAPATAEAMAYMRSLLPPDSHWAAFGIGRLEFPMVAQAVLLGGHVRVGLEDNLYLEKGVHATNAQLVEKAVKIITLLGAEVASPDEARDILRLPARR